MTPSVDGAAGSPQRTAWRQAGPWRAPERAFPLMPGSVLRFHLGWSQSTTKTLKVFFRRHPTMDPSRHWLPILRPQAWRRREASRLTNNIECDQSWTQSLTPSRLHMTLWGELFLFSVLLSFLYFLVFSKILHLDIDFKILTYSNKNVEEWKA